MAVHLGVTWLQLNSRMVRGAIMKNKNWQNWKKKLPVCKLLLQYGLLPEN